MPARETTHSKPKKTGKGKILFVEDDKFLAEMFRQKFVTEGYRPIIANTAISAVLALKEQQPIAVILDIVLKDSECWMIMEYLRRKPDWQPVPIILLTNYGNDEYRKKAEDLHADAFFIKTSITPAELVHAMEKLIRDHKRTPRERYRSPILE